LTDGGETAQNTALRKALLVTEFALFRRDTIPRAPRLPLAINPVILREVYGKTTLQCKRFHVLNRAYTSSITGLFSVNGVNRI
jgi:hypothetical protein